MFLKAFEIYSIKRVLTKMTNYNTQKNILILQFERFTTLTLSIYDHVTTNVMHHEPRLMKTTLGTLRCYIHLDSMTTNGSKDNNGK